MRPTTLLLSYTEFKKYTDENEITGELRQWLNEWESWDLACSPMDDNERKLIRYGHFLGYFAEH